MKGDQVKRYALCVAVAVSVVGCASAGREIRQDELSKFQKGETTDAQVLTALGNPQSDTTSSDGSRVLVYSFVHSQARPETFIPILGAFVGGADTRHTITTFRFGADHRLIDYTYSQGSTGTGTGLASGTYTSPNRSLPSENPPK